MIPLDSTLLKLQAALSSAATTTQPVAHVGFYDVPSQTKPGFEEYRSAIKRTVLNDTTEVDICAAPLSAGITRNIGSVSIVNRSAAEEIVTVSTYDGTNRYPLITKTLATNEGLYYEHGEGWYVAGA